MDGSLNHDPLKNSNILQGMLNDEVLHHWIFLVGYSYFDSIFLALPPYRPTALPPFRPALHLHPRRHRCRSRLLSVKQSIEQDCHFAKQ